MPPAVSQSFIPKAGIEMAAKKPQTTKAKNGKCVESTDPSFDGWGYAVFGKVTQGMDVVNKISKVSTGSAMGHQDVPTKPILIESIKLLPEKK